MSDKVAGGKRIFIAVSVLCGVLFGLQLLYVVVQLLTHRPPYDTGSSVVPWGDSYDTTLAVVVLGIATFVPPLIAYLYFDKQRSAANRKCPHCGEFIQPEAVVCRDCGWDLPPAYNGAWARFWKKRLWNPDNR